MTNDIKKLCKSLRLAYVADIYKDVPFNSPEDFLTKVLTIELEKRELTKASRNIKKARFLEHKTLEEYQWHKDIHLPPNLTVKELDSLRFIERKQNIVLVGAPGTGKTYLASAIGRKTCFVRSWKR